MPCQHTHCPIGWQLHIIMLAGLTLTFWISCLHLSAHTEQRLPKQLQVASLRLIPINTHHTPTMLLELRKLWWPEGRKKLLQYSQLCHQGEFWHLSLSAWRQSWQCSQKLHGLFVRAVLPMKVEASTLVVNEKIKALVTPPQCEFQ